MAEEKANGHNLQNGHPPDQPQQNGEKDDAPPPLEKQRKQKSDSDKEKQIAGGFDATPLPQTPPGYTIKITFHRATNLPMADINTLSSDPFIVAQIYTDLPSRHKEDPGLRVRTRTIRRKTDPVWNSEWIVANIPASGFRLKARVYDEDPVDHDDRLGNAHINIGRINESWIGIKDQAFPIKKRMGSKRAYFIRAVAACFSRAKHMNGHLYMSVEILGRSEGEGGRTYTIGPDWCTRHYSPLLGRIVGKKEPGEDDDGKKKKAERYDFQANQFQLRGPVPPKLYHRYVEFRPFVKSMFTRKGIRGVLLHKALHHQHARVYNFDSTTEYEVFESPCRDMTMKFLDLVHYDRGGRIFTYVLTLDSLFRFTETGKEFGVDMLSKHTMHSDVSIYIAFSGEFFIRRLEHPHRAPPEEGGKNASHPPDDISAGPPEDISAGPPEDDPPKDPAYYELVIDNDSGTYRPNASLLPQLKSFFESNFPGLHIKTLDCQGDAELMNQMKQEQRDKKKAEGDHIIYTQLSRPGSSLSSSDEEALDELEAEVEPRDTRLIPNLKREAAAKQKAKKTHLKKYKPGNNRDAWKENAGEGAGDGARDAPQAEQQ